MLWKGAKNRAMSATDMNTHSSRSHTIFQVACCLAPPTDMARDARRTSALPLV